ncbi:MAG: hypothetical protein IH962_04430, partial [Chloroflexi bacterium]|nr:hypothetical protein [Chloroflexota bacterium]
MPYCPVCGNAIEPSFDYCGFCGRALPEADPTPLETETPSPAPATLVYRLSPRRIVLMTVLSYGFYWYYWFYLTWKQYRDHTRNEAFPVWHAMSLSIPIYNLFRTHAHMRSFKELMADAGLESTINPGWAVVVVLISSVLGLVSFFLTGGLETTEVTFKSTLLAFALSLVSLVIVTKLLLRIQENLNRYWESLQNVTLTDARIASGEVLIIVIGALSWFTTL